MAAACSKGSRVNPDSAAVGGYSTYNSSPVGQYMMSIADDLVAGALTELETSFLLEKSEVTWNSRFKGMTIVKADGRQHVRNPFFHCGHPGGRSGGAACRLDCKRQRHTGRKRRIQLQVCRHGQSGLPDGGLPNRLEPDLRQTFHGCVQGQCPDRHGTSGFQWHAFCCAVYSGLVKKVSKKFWEFKNAHYLCISQIKRVW